MARAAMASSDTWRAKITTYTTAQGLATDSIYQLLADQRGLLWLSGPTTISSFPLPTPEPECRRRTSQGECLRASLRHHSGANVWRAPARRLRGPGRRHLVRQQQRCGARVCLSHGRALRRRERCSPESMPMAVSYPRLRRWFFRHRCLAWKSLLRRCCCALRRTFASAIKLENFDQDWIYAGTSRVASYTNLPAG